MISVIRTYDNDTLKELYESDGGIMRRTMENARKIKTGLKIV
jgi:hypothetical protein